MNVLDAYAKRFSIVGKMVLSTKLVQTRAMTRNCDVVIMLGAHHNDRSIKVTLDDGPVYLDEASDSPTSGSGDGPHGFMRWLYEFLDHQHPEVTCSYRWHLYTKSAAIYVTASYDSDSVLLRGAEALHLRKRLKSKYGQQFREFVYEERNLFENVTSEGGFNEEFLVSSERQAIIRYALHHVRAPQNITIKTSRGTFSVAKDQYLFPLLEEHGLVSVFPLHLHHTATDSSTELSKDSCPRTPHRVDLEWLLANWVEALGRRQPLDAVKEYFGVKIAIYFAWIGHYTVALTAPALLGFLTWLYLGTPVSKSVNSNATEVDVSDAETSPVAHPLWMVLFTLINVVWATVYAEHWKRHSSELTFRWGTLDREPELFAEPHPRFRGEAVKNAQTGRVELEYPDWRRQITRYLVSLPVILICLATVCFALFQVLQLQTAWRAIIEQRNLPAVLNVLVTMVFVGTIITSEKLYKPVAIYLNNLENYRLDEEYRNNLVLKLVLFHFIANYAALFYLAFFLQDRARLHANLVACFGTRQLLSLAQETAIPFALEKLRQVRLSYGVTQSQWPQLKSTVTLSQDESSDFGLRKRGAPQEQQQQDKCQSPEESLDGLQMTQAEAEALLEKYEDTYDDFLEMFIQFGYILMFTPVFPLAPVFGLLNNIFEIRGDAFKLCNVFRRPFIKSVSNIGIWQDLFDVLIVIGIVVNCAGVYVGGDLQSLLGWSNAQTMLLIVVLEHFLIGIRVGIAYAIPDTPKWVATEISVLEHKRRDALKKMEADRMELQAKADDSSPSHNANQ